MAITFAMGEFFSGPGGLSLGAELAADSYNQHIAEGAFAKPLIDIDHKWAVDIDTDSCETYRQNLVPGRPAAVHNIDARKAMLNLGSFDAVNGFVFGFPCNDFSLVGKQKGLLGDYGGLYQAGVAVLKEKQPEWFVAENVGGLRSANDGQAFQQILADLQAADYNVTPHLYRFEEYGVPQTRHRILVVGTHRDLPNEFKVPAPTHGPGLQEFVSAGSALEKPYPPGLEVTHQELTKQSPHVVERLKLIDPGENAFNAKRMTDEYRLNVKGATLSHIYRRLKKDEPSYTITGSGGGGTHVYHWAENRALTNRERARIQTFPDEFTFAGSRESVRKQIGMAVPPLGAKAVFEALFKTLNNVPYESTETNLLGVLEKSQTLLPTHSLI